MVKTRIDDKQHFKVTPSNERLCLITSIHYSYKIGKKIPFLEEQTHNIWKSSLTWICQNIYRKGREMWFP